MKPRAPVPHVTRPARARRTLGRLGERLAGPLLAPFAVFGALVAMVATRLQLNVGVQTVITSTPGPSDATIAPAATFFVAGQAERGDTASAIELRNMGDYAALLGARVTYGAVYDQLATFFGEGGTRAFVARVVGPAATKGNRTLVDRAGTPQNTIRIDAASEGAWSSGVTVAVADGAVANTVTITVAYAATGQPAEVYENLANPAAIVSALAASKWVRAVDLGSATASPTNNPNVLAATALSAGADDRASITSTHYTNALARFTPQLGTGIVAVPGQAYSAVGAALKAHALAYSRLAATALAVGTSVSAAQTAAAGARGTSDGSELTGLFFPWVKIPDGAGGLRTISPEGYVAGVRARNHIQYGPWKFPTAGRAVARYVIDTEIDLTATEWDALFGAAANPIRSDGGTRLYGWRSLSTDTHSYRDLNSGELRNYFATTIGADLEELVEDNITVELLAAMEAKARNRLIPVANAGGLFTYAVGGQQDDPGWSVSTAANNGTTASQRQAILDVGFRPTPGADLILFRLTHAAADTPFS